MKTPAQQTVEIRHATKKDLPRLIALYQAGSRNEANLFDTTITAAWTDRPKTRKQILERLNDPKSIELVPIVNGRIVGYLIGVEIPPIPYRIKQKTGELMAFFVEERYRCQGIGQALMTEFLTWCKQRKLEAIRLTVSAGNSRAIAFYERHGFHVLDTIMEINPKNKHFQKKIQEKKKTKR